jgi:hypothetical protein
VERSDRIRSSVKALAAEAKDAVRSRTIVLPRNRRTQLDELRRTEPLLQALAQFRSHIRRSRSNRIRQFENELLVGVEEIAFLVPVQVSNLLVGQARRLTCGGVDIDSKRTFHQLGGANLSQHFEPVRNEIRFLQRHAEFGVGNEEIGMRGNCGEWSNVFAEAFAGEAADECNLQCFEHNLSSTD